MKHVWIVERRNFGYLGTYVAGAYKTLKDADRAIRAEYPSAVYSKEHMCWLRWKGGNHLASVTKAEVQTHE